MTGNPNQAIVTASRRFRRLSGLAAAITAIKFTHSLTYLYESSSRRELGVHFHFWQLVLACVPGAAVLFIASRIPKPDSSNFVQQNPQLQQRIVALEKAVNVKEEGAPASSGSAAKPDDVHARVMELEAKLRALEARLASTDASTSPIPAATPPPSPAPPSPTPSENI